MTNEIISRLIEASTESFDLYQSGLGETTVLFCNPHTLVTSTIQECVKLIQEEKQEIENMKHFSIWAPGRGFHFFRKMSNFDKQSASTSR